MAIVELLSSGEGTKAYVESTGAGDDAAMQIAGEIRVRHEDLRELTNTGLIDVTDTGRVTVTHRGRRALREARRSLMRGRAREAANG